MVGTKGIDAINSRRCRGSGNDNSGVQIGEGSKKKPIYGLRPSSSQKQETDLSINLRREEIVKQAKNSSGQGKKRMGAGRRGDSRKPISREKEEDKLSRQ